jgi:GT2 family glycosyltransferase
MFTDQRRIDPRSTDRLAIRQPDNREKLALLTEQIRQLRTELSTAYRTRDSLGGSLRKLFKSGTWRFIRPFWMLFRMVGFLDRDITHLVPMTDVYREPDGTLHGHTLPKFLLPTVPLTGWVRVRAKLYSSVSSQACLYFDTGGAFHQQDHFVLAPVVGPTEVERVIFLKSPTFLFRFDPIQATGDFRVESFSLQPWSTLWFHAEAIGRNLLMMITDTGSHRPSVWLGLTLLLTGKWSTFHQQLVANFESITNGTHYDAWRRQRQLTDTARQAMRVQIARWYPPPTISIVLPVFNVPEIYLRKCIDSVLRQIYPYWELCIVDDGSTRPHIRKVLDEYAAADERIKVSYQAKNTGISAASNAALELATGEFIALLDHDDEIAEHALFKVVEAIVDDPALDMIYSDEDKLSSTGRHVDPFFKPDWSPEYFTACMYTCHLSVYRTELIRGIGGWRSEFDGAQDYDLALRVVSHSQKIFHIPDVLYHWRVLPTSTASHSSAKPLAYGRARKAIESHLQRMGRRGKVEDGPSVGFHRVRYEIAGNPRVSIIMPTACKTVQFRGRDTWFVLECVRSIRKRSTYGNFEIVVIDNDDMPDDLALKLKTFNVTIVSFTGEFNLASKINFGAAAATGEHLLILNDDTEVISPDWIQCMLEYSQWPEIGAVGAQLLFPNGTQQHNGVNVVDGRPGHPFYQFPGDHPGYFNSSVVHRNWSAVTGACMMTRADVFHAVDGFSESFPLNYNDVDYCLKVNQLGKRIVYTPYAKLYHHESVSKTGTDVAELEAFQRAWAERFPRDPYYNPNLTTESCDFRIA